MSHKWKIAVVENLKIHRAYNILVWERKDFSMRASKAPPYQKKMLKFKIPTALISEYLIYLVLHSFYTTPISSALEKMAKYLRLVVEKTEQSRLLLYFVYWKKFSVQKKWEAKNFIIKKPFSWFFTIFTLNISTPLIVSCWNQFVVNIKPIFIYFLCYFDWKY